MFLHQLLNGVLIGLPLMLTLGPVSILLINQGMSSGSRSGLPAALGVASADLTYSTLAAAAGSALVAALNPLSGLLRLFGAAVIIGIAVKIALGSRSQMAAIKQGDEGLTQFKAQRSFGHLRGGRLAGTFYGITIVNPMTIILLSAVVVAGGKGTGTPGWVVGMTLASLLAHTGYLVFGSFLRRTFNPAGMARVGMISAVLMVATAAHLVAG